ncbi:hypothetical protein CW700_05580 [Candidatus Bathyarchaeota archaeon]|nr:MAG: hypothetical protein CW700_05580 [Candidatus Bathyarchaeota archaeon]
MRGLSLDISCSQTGSLLFVKENELFKKTYNFIADIPYDHVKGFSAEGRYTLKVKVGERSYSFIS